MAKGKMKILHAIRQGLIGGGETHVLDLVRHLDKEKYESHVLSFTDGPMIEKLAEMGIKTNVIFTTKPFDVRVWKTVRAYLAEEKFDLIHAHGTRAASNLLKPSRSEKIPIIYTVHGWSFHDDQAPLVKKLRIWSEKYISDRTDLNISVSKSNQITGRNYFGTYHSTVINNGIDIEKFNPQASYNNLRESLNIDPKKRLICCTMRMTKQKDPLTMIKAFSIALKKTSNIHLLMVGDGELKEDAVLSASELGINEHVTFEHFRSDIPNVLHSSDIYCLPSLWEGLPIGLLEAMAVGMAVIATKVDGSKEIIRNNENGILVSPQQPNQLAEAIVKINEDEKFNASIAKEAAQTVLDKYNVVKMTQEIENTYTKLLTA